MKLTFLLFGLFFVSPAFADGWDSFEATTTANLKLRAAPGLYTEIAMIPAQTKVVIGTCFFEGAWCSVTTGEISGFVDATYLQVGQQTVQEKYAIYWENLQAKSAKWRTPSVP